MQLPPEVFSLRRQHSHVAQQRPPCRDQRCCLLWCQITSRLLTHITCFRNPTSSSMRRCMQQTRILCRYAQQAVLCYAVLNGSERSCTCMC